MRSLIIIAVLIIAMILGKLLFFNQKEPSSEKSITASKDGKKNGKSGTMPVDIYIANQSNNDQEVYASATLIANEEVELRSEASGRLVKLYFKEGSKVSKGQLIAKLNDADIQARLKKVKYEAELAAQIEARQKKLLDINAISKEEYDIAINKINTLSADKEALDVALAQTEVRAPFSGTIGLKNISVGAYVGPSTTIATLVQTNPIKMDFSIPEKYVSRIKIGRKVDLAIEGVKQNYQATITAIDPKIDEVLRTAKVRCTITNNAQKLMPGMFVKVIVPVGSSQSIMLPTESIIPFAGGKKIYVKSNGQAKENTIITGLRTESQVEVLSGLAKGDSVIVSGIMNLKNGQNVKTRKVVNQ